MLHQRGGLGVTPVDFTGPDVIDGGAPILRLAGRINDLRNQGYVIRTFKKGQVARYVLVPDFALTTSEEAPVEVVGVTAGVAGPEWSTESPTEDYIAEEELQWV